MRRRESFVKLRSKVFHSWLDRKHRQSPFMHQSRIDTLVELLFPAIRHSNEDGPELYVVMDGARDSRVYRAIYESRLDYECLYTGSIPSDLAEAAPYLVRLTRTAALTRWVLQHCWGNSVGIFAWSGAHLATLQRHFRRLLQVQDERGRRLYFRYYDPRVLRVFVPTCTALDMRALFGPVERLLVEGTQDQVLSCEPRIKSGFHHLQWEARASDA